MKPSPTLLTHKARIVFGRHHVFRFEHPEAEGRSLPADVAAHDELVRLTQGGTQPVDWELAQREVWVNGTGTSADKMNS